MRGCQGGEAVVCSAELAVVPRFADLFISGKGALGRGKRQRRHRDSEGDHVSRDGELPPRKKAFVKKGSKTDKAPSRSVAGKGKAKFRLRVKTAVRVGGRGRLQTPRPSSA